MKSSRKAAPQRVYRRRMTSARGTALAGHAVERFDHMAEVLVSFDEPIRDSEGNYHARAVGRQASDRMWEGWVEFVPLEGGAEVLVTPVESRQPEREHLVYWATGLTSVYLEGALHRARNPLTVRVRTIETPASDSPAPRDIHVRPRSTVPEAVLDPFEVGARNLDILRQELSALNRPRLMNIVEAYDLNPAGEDISWMTNAQLIHFVVVAVDTQLPQRIR
jgi:hypothetical protein